LHIQTQLTLGLFLLSVGIGWACASKYPPRDREQRAPHHYRKVADQLLALTARELAREQDHGFLLLSTTAQERVIRFLIEMVQRASPREDHLIALPMSRLDIADYLGLTLETVSRTLWDLERRGASKSRAAVASYCAISLAMEEAKGCLSFSRALRVDGPRQKMNCTNGLPLPKAKPLRYLILRLYLAGAREHCR